MLLRDNLTFATGLLLNAVSAQYIDAPNYIMSTVSPPRMSAHPFRKFQLLKLQHIGRINSECFTHCYAAFCIPCTAQRAFSKALRAVALAPQVFYSRKLGQPWVVARTIVG
jgi:hypothetical protein